MDTIEVQPKDEAAPKSNSIVETSTSLDPCQETKSERWNSLRQWIHNRLEDEKASPMPRRQRPPKKPSLHPRHDLSVEELSSFRARHISVTLCKESRESKWGFSLQQQQQQPAPATIGRVQIKRMAKRPGTLLEYAPFEPGDVLLSINRQLCTDATTTIQQLVEMESNVPITLLVETPQGNPNSVQVMVQKPVRASTLGLQFDSIKNDYEGNNDEQGNNKDETRDHNSTLVGLEPRPNEYQDKDNRTITSQQVGDRYLRIQAMEPNGILAHSPLRPGDIVVAINATPCSQMSPMEASSLLYQSSESVTIIAVQPSPTRQQQWLRQARRAGVAIGGGTMVGIGLIFIPTLPPPFGEALLVGGVSVLGTEFETPKRIMKSARDSFERVVGSSSDDEESSGTLEDNPTECISKQDDASNQLRSNGGTMKGRVKSFGRRHVLPLLNQAVGDRQPSNNGNNG